MLFLKVVLTECVPCNANMRRQFKTANNVKIILIIMKTSASNTFSEITEERISTLFQFGRFHYSRTIFVVFNIFLCVNCV